ncbi:tripartite tricarboxylate transporter TctB family protein [Paracoccus aerodenitrificans]|uniref:tripartite tricarboxylate transporter TctB family protein n=1 Tax=Paracoccus aerodenitrificans TaxID=3017781 RepID=UPI0022F05528|nr:tripartite tricarboxylate transporter TctB family protein [Paracoccus aerodenitrificans]WBU64797.1 tripartite tricarboxylate transporter TctB family protein [Paracoccus aerodenitrificans]
MPHLNLFASVVTCLFLIGLSLVLAGPAFELPGLGPKGGLQSGTLPQFVVVTVAALSVLSLASDILKWRRGMKPGVEIEPEVAPLRQVLVVGGGIMVLLAVYVFAWRPLPFPLISFVFFALVGAILAPPAARSTKGYGVIALTGIVFSVAVWLLFTYVLKVPLR